MISLHSYSRLALSLSFASLPLIATAQTKVEQQNPPSRVIRCVIETERRDWKSNEPAIVAGQIESLFDGPVEVKVVPVLYVSSATSDALRATYWSPVDVLHDTALSTDRQVIGPKANAKQSQSRAAQFCSNLRKEVIQSSSSLMPDTLSGLDKSVLSGRQNRFFL
jgi:hypothetical protein